jgi:hypothetical protein
MYRIFDSIFQIGWLSIPQNIVDQQSMVIAFTQIVKEQIGSSFNMESLSPKKRII